jgi:large subunit ribosomal protein L23
MIGVIRKPLVTEKAMKLGGQGQYAFLVNPKANKIEIRRAVEEMFEVDVVSIRTMKVKGKMKTKLTKTGMMRGNTPSKKKAIVTLKEGQTIDLVSGEAAE